MTAKTVSLLLLGSLALAACAQPVRAPQPVGVPTSVAPADRLVAAIESEGCVLTRDNLGAVLLRANLTQAELPAVTAALDQQARIEPTDDNAIRVLSDNCI